LPEDAVHVIDKNLALLRVLGIEAVGQREFPLPVALAAQESVARQLGTLGGPLVILNPAGGWASKLWPAEAFGALALGLAQEGARILVTHGPGEENLADRVVASSSGAATRCFPTTLGELAEVFRRAALVIAADTGPLHLACAVRTPVVGLFGPTDPARNGPFRAEDIVVRRVPACAPCHRRVCPVHERIMTTLPVDEVLRAARRRLASGREERSVA
jgi:ADP-heptose:LPS heptosyltransferase